MTEVKKSASPRILAIFGAITALLAAATPGLISLLDTTAAIAKVQAEVSVQSARRVWLIWVMLC